MCFGFSKSGELLRLLDGAGLTEVSLTEHATTYSVPIRKSSALERCPSIYRSASSLGRSTDCGEDLPQTNVDQLTIGDAQDSRLRFRVGNVGRRPSAVLIMPETTAKS